MSLLADLTAGAVADAESRRAELSLAEVERRAAAQSPALDAVSFLSRGETIRVIAEVKRASPSRGDLAEIPDPALQAARYEQGGASAISVLTEGRRFKGSLADLTAVKQQVTLPVLRKDFIATPYQVAEARAAGADLVLLIVAALDRKTIGELYAQIREFGMTPLVEAHSADEVKIATDLGAPIIGVNARDLSDFTLDRDLFARLAPGIPDGTIRVAESAVSTPDDVVHYRRGGADVVLIGEALVTGDPVATLDAFISATEGI
ncbi:indole-3-glycerol phosphate synthase 1 [Microbacterium sorbitolivorans]|uniref:indole-3-glycerol-phosphate synthase n=1 Tax=Microbacterium sorbitolivorans TaxID=1867410 RepID=A0A367Y9C7_9MICO|nr:indole-3-glycerol phosphate synthase TrpC [Microbacterium sorbitolivorans]RCK61591.1 indole-3-glycerol phosphate synthase TrpC [Microbacterium sorbitolivorans]GGF30868.1 indole-3-glycerol phosphate synthase 1 [Microbacterium sorbitolivorans]